MIVLYIFSRLLAARSKSSPIFFFKLCFGPHQLSSLVVSLQFAARQVAYGGLATAFCFENCRLFMAGITVHETEPKQ